MRQCPKYKDLPSNFKRLPLRLWHSGNHNDCCSRAIALGFARFIEWQVLVDEPKRASEPKCASEPKDNFSESWWDDFIEPIDCMEPKQDKPSLSEPKQDDPNLSEPKVIVLNVKSPMKVIINVL
ncbi:hypothetical protein AVEN_100647-1 [Araneus ventricosus]|uniref:Uncharacterized protein n=1 Tax=Araneus ventricosus TaxID=182803 RepID=A0A4Y2UV25_ARAVE|nr:hypothetical protein AVEN_100647-1 [Araneus ventricosus]